MRKASLIVAALAVLLVSGGVALADTLVYPYFLVDETFAWFSSDEWLRNVSPTTATANVNLYAYDGSDLVTNPATVVTILPNETIQITLNGLIPTSVYSAYGGFVKASMHIEGVTNFDAVSIIHWGAITAMQSGAGYLFFPSWM